MVKYLPELHNKIWLSSSDDQMATKTEQCIHSNLNVLLTGTVFANYNNNCDQIIDLIFSVMVCVRRLNNLHLH